MNDLPHKALLPAGFPDILPPQAGHEAAVTAALIASLTAQGYERVKPPLVEYEDTLLSGPGAAMAQQTFRLMDPVSQRMMGVRADLTLQIARIAETRLAQSPKPQRLCYAGDVLRVKGDQLRPERQFTQVGAELIDGPAPSADVEVVLLAVGALAEAGARRLSIDLKQPKLVPTLLDEVAPLAGKADALRDALDRKDTARVAELGGDAAATLAALMTATGPAAQAVPALAALDLPKRAAAERDRLLAVVGPVVEALPDVTVTVDPVEHRGFE
ncbi:MAG: ATP phosphoribosyltransferase regulatory subunit, partial [Inquilinus sp.]|nr:ATP phosphoribosyltransferase regulatory subunit [Inquilinus sp.]